MRKLARDYNSPVSQTGDDWIEEVYEAWNREFPEADTQALKTLTRLARLSVLLGAFQQNVLSPLGLVISDFTVLAALRRLGPPYSASPSSLYNVLERSSGGMTKMIRRLEAVGLVERSPDPDDGRGSLVRLTAAGIEAHNESFAAFREAADRLLAGMTAAEVRRTDASLQALVSAFEDYFYV